MGQTYLFRTDEGIVMRIFAQLTEDRALNLQSRAPDLANSPLSAMAMSTLEALAYPLDPALTSADIIVLRNLLSEISARGTKEAAAFSGLDHDDETSIKLLEGLSDEQSESFRPTVFTGWDQDHLQRKLPAFIYMNVLLPYIDWAQGIVRKPTDVVFLTHVIIYLCTLLPSAVWLFVRFSWPHAICHWCMVIYSCGPFTIMLHNHIHNNGVLNRNYAWLDQSFPYLLEPLMGHTWDSYYFHHVKHHHVEGNGPDDLSSTIRYQRDDLIDFLTYVVRFLAFIWVELPLYFLRKGKQELAIRSFVSEMVSYTAIYMLAGINLRAAMFVLLVPLLQTRIGMMIGNWGQHALVDDIEPNSDFRSSITLFDVPVSNLLFL